MIIHYWLRALYREVRCDLILAALAEAGWTQKQLAEAMNVTPAFVSEMLRAWPASRDAGADRPVLLTAERAAQIADLLHLPDERRSLLVRVTEAERNLDFLLTAPGESLSPEAVAQLLDRLAALHHDADRGADAAVARAAYLDIVRTGAEAVERIPVRSMAIERAQTFMYLHDAECVLNRPDLALLHACQAAAELDRYPAPPRRAAHVYHAALRTNASAAIVTALNNLGLPRQATEHAEAAAVAMQTRDCGEVAPVWQLHLATSRLSALRRLPEPSVLEAWRLYGQAETLVTSGRARALLDNQMADTLIAHAIARDSRRSLKKARDLAELGAARAGGQIELGPLARAMLYRTAAWQADHAGETGRRDAYLSRCLTLIDAAGLTHQRAQVEVMFGANRTIPIPRAV